ncbi:response regulator transcription factor [Enterocloster citroniae]|uniref:Stage 0 sporulation protein A homolog n=2 Tax=Enterocloster citroniae TaxID=358743 RepID=A0ABV2FZR7_9FIRM|nr:helix-turn-helix domain-containing protein [Enterocloster citroniae]KMW14511.1 hypothetical protein HMPREF9470_04817 [[Clostridium] citroniae WAL-19142]
MKVLIIDDEISTRESIKILAGMTSESGDEVYEARNGLEGYQMIEKVQPDLIFLDMNMPVLDGADLLNILDENTFQAKIIIVSGYTDFRYTKAAIIKKYVVDYIQKPIDEKQIRDAIQKATGRAQNERIDTTKIQTKKVQTGKGNGHKENEEQKEIMFGIFIEDFQTVLKKNYNGSVEVLQYFVMCQAEHQIPNLTPYAPKEEIYQYACFFTVNRTESRGLNEALNCVTHRLENRYGLNAYAVYSDESKTDLYQMYMEICEFINYADLGEDGRVVRTARPEPVPQTRSETAYWAGELLYCGKNRNREQFEKTVHYMFENMENSGIRTIYERKIFISGLIFEIGRRLNEKGLRMEKRVSEKMEELYSGKLMFTKKFAQRWIKEFMEEIWEISGAEAVEIPDKLREVLYYIQKNYNKKISLSEVSDQFYFNASTVSRMFVKYLGINYIEYVNTLRLEKAKEMLGNSKMNVSEVAERTGFESLSYFSKQFKKKYGVSPQDFRKNK